MQLQLSIAERQLLADLLAEANYSLMEGSEPAQEILERKLRAREYDGLMAEFFETPMEFSADELKMLMILLKCNLRDHKQGAPQEPRDELLQSLTDKITDACVMT